jgi:anti-anti-sigma regulatory factor
LASQGGGSTAAVMQGKTVYSDNRLVITRTVWPGALSISGSIDHLNADDVARALIAELQTADDGGGELSYGGSGTQLCVDLSRLEFVDTCGIKALVKVAKGAGNGQRLVLQGLPPLIRKVMLVVGWGDLPGLVLDAGA